MISAHAVVWEDQPAKDHANIPKNQWDQLNTGRYAEFGPGLTEAINGWANANIVAASPVITCIFLDQSYKWLLVDKSYRPCTVH